MKLLLHLLTSLHGPSRTSGESDLSPRSGPNRTLIRKGHHLSPSFASRCWKSSIFCLKSLF
jgi:hypothetical protein